MKKDYILVTGGAGYIGSHAAKKLAELSYRVVVLDNLSRGLYDAVAALRKKWPVEFIKGDTRSPRDVARLFRQYRCSAVLHFAGLCSVDESMKDPGEYFSVNTSGTLNLLQYMHEFGVSKLIFSSTCAVYGEAKRLPIDERHEVNPVNPYGESKLMAERIIKWFGVRYGLNYVILRYFNVCGADPDGLIGDSKKPSILLVQNAIRGALGIEKFEFTCPKVDTRDGSPIRDYVDVNDLIDAHITGLRYLERKKAGIALNLGTGRGYSVKEIVDECERITGRKITRGRGVARKGEYAALYADNSEAKRVLRWSPRRSLEDSVKSLISWYNAHPRGFKK